LGIAPKGAASPRCPPCALLRYRLPVACPPACAILRILTASIFFMQKITAWRPICALSCGTFACWAEKAASQLSHYLISNSLKGNNLYIRVVPEVFPEVCDIDIEVPRVEERVVAPYLLKDNLPFDGEIQFFSQDLE